MNLTGLLFRLGNVKNSGQYRLLSQRRIHVNLQIRHSYRTSGESFTLFPKRQGRRVKIVDPCLPVARRHFYQSGYFNQLYTYSCVICLLIKVADMQQMQSIESKGILPLLPNKLLKNIIF